jgi:hypothetical protein
MCQAVATETGELANCMCQAVATETGELANCMCQAVPAHGNTVVGLKTPLLRSRNRLRYLVVEEHYPSDIPLADLEALETG